MRILLVEDEDRIASFVMKGLTAEGHSIERARNVQQALSLLPDAEYELVLMDLRLPDGDGREVLQQMRTGVDSTPVLVLTAVGDIEDKVDLLDSGANDYLTKPFAFAKLSARVRALTRQEQR